MSFEIFPSEVLLHIASFLSAQDLLNMCVSHEMSLICRDYSLWSRLFVKINTKDCPLGRLCHSGVMYNEKMYVFGGHITQPATEFFSDVKQDMYEYSFDTRSWFNVPGLNAPKRTEHSALIWKDSMVVFGGYSGASYESSTHTYNYGTSQWAQIEAKGTVPEARSAHTAAIHDDKMFVFGGWNGDKCTNDMYQLDLNSNVWARVQTTGTSPCARCSHGTVVYAQGGSPKLYIFGGYAMERASTSSRGYLNDLFELDLTTMVWSERKQGGDVPSPRSRFRVVPYGKFLYLFGGWNSAVHHNSLYRLNLDTLSWKLVDTDFDRSGLGQFSIVANDDRMYIFSGFSPKENTSLQNLYAYQLPALA